MEMHGVDDTSMSTSCKERKKNNIWERESGVGEKEHVGPRHIGVSRKGKTRSAPHVCARSNKGLSWSEDRVYWR